ncbi:restriction endonuclease subunit S [Photobacterium sp. CAU 1568]|uniref:Restriction endonuclease subunit S n=1 Tax=Photobacterium arenosum TaxID=2774143 RepID=A0ABR9BPV0_9GAMM|nr:restriction endonuclease subunit S [Photobacterium arenosum]MBD8514283.1 restriction endonuclease subunit S [Photobacterium arenosum]
MVPKGWTPSQIGDVAKFSSGGTPSKQNADYWGGTEPWISGKDLKTHYLETSIDALTEAGFQAAKKAPKGATLVLVRGMTLLKDFPVGYATREVAFNQDVKALVPAKNVDGLFLSFLLVAEKHKILQLVSTAGHGTGRLDTHSLQEYPVNIPPLPEQKKIAQILSTWDKAIATTEQLLANSQQQKKALMQQLLTGKKRLGMPDNSYDFKKTRYGIIPKDWEYPAIKDVCTQVTEKNTESADYPVLSCSKYDGFVDSLKYFKKKVYSDDTSGYRLIHRGCFGFPSNHIEEGSIGLQNLYDTGIVSPIYVIFRAKPKKVENTYLYAVLKTDHYRQIFGAATNASVDRRGSLRWKEFSLIHVPLPPLEEQQRIAVVLSTADQEISALQQKLEALKQEKKALMQQLLTGKRRVKVDDKEVA